LSKNIFYFHGFASSADSTKAIVFNDFIKEKFPNISLHIPNIDNSIEKSFIQLEKLVGKNKGDRLFIGSSLGGFYATYFAEKLGSKAVLINPASNPYLGMEMYLGKNINYSTNEEFYLTKKDLEILKLNNVLKVNSPANYLVLIETGDDVIPFKYTLDFYSGCNFRIVNGGSHSFDSFKEKLEIISKFMEL
tara:strand:- start:77 stop:649 length:573 start_codon:yes stop_codon:yes gene_type:complete